PTTPPLFPSTTLFRSAAAGAIKSEVGNVSAEAMALRSLATSLVVSGVNCLAGGAAGCNGRPSASSVLSSLDSANAAANDIAASRSEEHTSELQSRGHL